MQDAAVSVRGLTKSYGPVEAVRGIDLSIDRGEVFALLGPNGAGKTTTIEILEGFRQRDGGDVSVLGADPSNADHIFKQRIGIVLQATSVEPYLTVAEAVELYRGYYPHPRPRDEIIELVGLTEERDMLVRRLSGGQQRRLDVAIGLAGDPELLFLDEPTTGFDPAARRGAWQMVRDLSALGKTIVLTTHYMEEAERLADRVAIIVRGKIVATGAPHDLAHGAGGTHIEFTLPDAKAPLPPELDGASRDGARVELLTAEPEKALHALTGWALANGVKLEDLRVASATLEDAYLQLATDDHAEDAP